ncbi:alpha-amylase [Liberiplasma polymorphum]|uniref:alpha-amylase n=1 Tax=Liberiplasma polymorphum TaxID=3374570 RepID=UPI0037763FA4
MQTLKLEKLLHVLKEHANDTVYNYTVPDLWNCFDYKGEELIKTPNHELMVNPYNFFSYLIEHVLLKKHKTDFDPGVSLSKALNLKPKKTQLAGDWVKESVMYSTMIRTSAAWDNDRSGALEDENIYKMKETGTFVKMLALLPLLDKMGINTVYMLPISKFSLKDKKGDLGSPYGVSNFNELDPNLKESLTKDAMTLDEEFQAFIEACHLLNMRVMIDIIPRTNAVENDLIKDHPDWFYWIKASAFDQYRVPYVEGIEDTASPVLEHMPKVYESDDVLRHINMFQLNPKAQDAALWEKVRKSKNIIDAIEKHYDLKIAPAFSDHINDIQPPWTDITFFRMYMDHPKETVGFLKNKAVAPYILYDTIKSNMYHGEIPNDGLWEKLANIVPSYQKRFGIDGARIDMGHALPAKLIQMIFDRARKIDPDFAFIAEELQPKNASAAREVGYNMIIGNGFIMAPRIWQGKAHEFYYDSRHLKAPVFACTETHDTPRIAARDGYETLSKTTTILNMFMPNGVPFINSGQEIFEKQPMNTGLDCSSEDLYKLEPNDPYYGKLPLFDRYQFHYLHRDRWVLPNILDFIKPFRKKYLSQITNTNYFVHILDDNKLFIGYAFYKKTKANKNNVLLVLANLNPYHEYYSKPSIKAIRDASNNHETIGKLLFSTHEGPRDFTQFYDYNQIDLHLGAGEVKIVEF